MRLSIELIVASIIILVVALVVLTIFITGIVPIGPLTDARAYCINTGSASCKSMKELPPTWESQKMNYANTMQTCKEITGIDDCSGFP